MIGSQLVNENFFNISGDCLRKNEKKKSLNCRLSHLRTLRTLADGPPSLQFYQPFWMHGIPSVCVAFLAKYKVIHSSTVRGRGIPLPGLSLISRQFILTQMMNFWPKQWFITWVNPSSEYSLLGSDSLFGSEHIHSNSICIAILDTGDRGPCQVIR